MRLTLRTLIAYLDDELQPDQAKEIGLKLTESSYATALVERIKDVMRRRRLSAPELFGKGAGLDPNLVAEYLDSELTPAEVVDVEKICLDSDMHLAEVAACHQILTLVLGDPVEVRSETRSRMYALGPVAADDALRANDFVGSLLRRDSIPMIASTVNSSQNGSTDHTLPDYLQPNSSRRQSMMLVIVLLIAIGWVGLLMRDPTVTNGLNSGNWPEDENPISNNSVSTPDDLPGTNEAESTTPDKSDVPLVAQLDPAISNKPRDVRVATPKELPDKEPEPEAVPVIDQPVKPVPTPSRPIAEANNPPKVEPTEVPLAKVMPPQKLSRVSKDGILLRFEQDANDFMVLSQDATITSGDRLVCPEPFRADLIVGDDLCLVALVGGTSVRPLGPDEHSSLGFEVQQGALLFEARGLHFAGDNPNETLRQPSAFPITLMVSGRRYRLELASDDALCGVEVHRHEPTHFETELVAPGFTASLHVARGSVRFVNTDAKVTQVTGPGFFSITSDVAANLRNSEIGRASQLLLPDWLEPDPKRAAAKMKRPYSSLFEKEFDADQPLLLNMPAVVANPRPALSELAVKCLALTDSYGPLVKALSKGDHREARLAAITGLREWLPLDPRNQRLLKTELTKHFLPSEGDAVYQLLWGFDQSDAKNPVTSRMLVGWLESEHLAIRELAFFHVQSLTGLKHEYSPINPPAQRRAAVDRWYNHLDKKGGALVQE